MNDDVETNLAQGLLKVSTPVDLVYMQMSAERSAIASGKEAMFGVSGLSTGKNIRTAGAAVGVAGLDRNGFAEISAAGVGVAGINTAKVLGASRQALGDIDAAALHQRDSALADLVQDSNRLGDRAARNAWRRGVWFADFTYITTPYHVATDNGGHVRGAGIGWRNGREATFGRQHRALPLFIDSSGYRRELTGTAPQWAKDFDVYPAAIELIDPDGYAAWDYPQDRARSMDALQRLLGIFPQDATNGRLWPVFSVRWTWDASAHLSFSHLPGWVGRDLASLIPQTRTQKQFKRDTLERWARQAIANALVIANDPDFRWMADTFGQVMIGGMVRCEMNRQARHLFAAALTELFPGVKFWLLGQANFATVNGLGMMGLLDRVWTDGTWWLQDATAERFAYVENGLITMHSFESSKIGRDGKRQVWRQTFFTLVEMMAANLRSLLAAYEGLWSWPPPEPLPVDLLDMAQVSELKQRYIQAKLELGL